MVLDVKNFERVYKTGRLTTGRSVQSKYSSGWFFIQILNLINMSNLNVYCDRHNICLDTNDRIDYGWYYKFLSEKQLDVILSEKLFSVYPITKENKEMRSVMDSSSNNKYIVEATKQWVEENNKTYKISHFVNNRYLVSGLIDSRELLSDYRVLSAKPHFTRKVMNRFTSGFLQSGSQDASFYEGYVANKRSFHERGILGEGEIITVIDTGVDQYHPFFHDPNRSVPVNKYDPEHRKIVKLYAVSDAKDCASCHGTHVCGTAAGESFDKSYGISMYNGVAPKSKLIVIDIGNSSRGNSLDGDYDIEETTREYLTYGSYINSNSWGADSDVELVRDMYDTFAWKFPDVLFVFAAGNTGTVMGISAPSDAKNVLSVGSTSALGLSRISMGIPSSNMVAKYEDISIDLNIEKTFSMTRYILQTNSRHLYEVGVSRFGSSDYDGKVVISSETLSCSDIQSITDGGALAIIHKCTADPVCESYSIPVFNTDKVDQILGFKNITIFENPEIDMSLRRAGFQSMGPTGLNMIKPDIVVPGQTIVSSNAGNPHDSNVRGIGPTNLISKSGTSMSCPAVSGLAALIREYLVKGYFPCGTKGCGQSVNPSSYLLRALLICSSARFDALSKPDNVHGFGVPNLENIFPGGTAFTRFVDRKDISPNKRVVYSVYANKTDRNLSFVLSYFEPSTGQYSTRPLLCNLDLVVISPSGRHYYGNGSPDPFNTNEKVIISCDEVEDGDYEINILSNNFDPTISVKYAFVVSGSIATEQGINPLEIPETEGSKLKCGSLANADGCVCKQNDTGLTCGSTFQELEFYNDEIHIFDFGEVKYYRTNLTNDTEVFTLKLGFKDFSIVHVGLSFEPFHDLMDKDVVFFSSRASFSAQVTVNPAEHSVVYFAIYASCARSVNVSFSAVRDIPYGQSTVTTNSFLGTDNFSILQSHILTILFALIVIAVSVAISIFYFGRLGRVEDMQTLTNTDAHDSSLQESPQEERQTEVLDIDVPQTV